MNLEDDAAVAGVAAGRERAGRSTRRTQSPSASIALKRRGSAAINSSSSSIGRSQAFTVATRSTSSR